MDEASSEDVAELRRRLADAEETLRAIREGEVDALVVRSSRADEVFTLQSGDEPYRAFMETMELGAAALSPAGLVHYANAAFCKILDRAPADLERGNVLDILDGAASKLLGDALARADGRKVNVQIRIPVDGQARHYMASVAPFRIGVADARAVVLFDLTDRIRAERSAIAEQTARAIISSANEAVVVCDSEGRITHANGAVKSIAEGELIGQPFMSAINLSILDPTGLLTADGLLEVALSGGSLQGVEAQAPLSPKTRELLVSAAPLRSGEDQHSGCVVTMVDISPRKAAERHQLLLMGELDHRVKNTLALVLSILGRTQEDTVEEFKKTFSSRIHALAATHNLLASNQWSNLTLADIVTAELSPYITAPGERVKFNRLDIQVTPRAAIALGLIFHELAANAAKYGALADLGGQLSISAGANDGAALEVEWRESGGPPVSEPTRKGFGRTIIDRSLKFAESGGADLRFAPTGVVCTLRVPVTEVVARSERR